MKDTAEERVVQQLARWLLSIGYEKYQIQTHPQYTVPIGRKQLRVDVAVFKGTGREARDLLLIGECKRGLPGGCGLDQLRGYLRETGAKVGIWFNGTDMTYVVDIPSAFHPDTAEQLARPKSDVERAAEFGRHIRQRREFLHHTDPTFSLRQVAARVGISPAYLSRIEQGSVVPPKDEIMERLAADLGEDVHVVFARAGRISKKMREAILLHPKFMIPMIEAIGTIPDSVPDEIILKLIRGEVRDGKW